MNTIEYRTEQLHVVGNWRRERKGGGDGGSKKIENIRKTDTVISHALRDYPDS